MTLFVMADRPTILERAFYLAATGRVNSVADIRSKCEEAGSQPSVSAAA